jgi:hypothetical protein
VLVFEAHLGLDGKDPAGLERRRLKSADIVDLEADGVAEPARVRSGAEPSTIFAAAVLMRSSVKRYDADPSIFHRHGNDLARRLVTAIRSTALST